MGESLEESPELEEPVRSGEPSGVGGYQIWDHHWGQGSHHVDDHPLGPQHWGQGSHHVADHPLGPPATSSGSRFCNDRARGSGLVSSSGYLVGALFWRRRA